MLIVGAVSLGVFIIALIYSANMNIQKKTKKQKWMFISLLISTFIGLNVGFIYSLYVLNETAIVMLGTATVCCVVAISVWVNEIVKNNKVVAN